MSSQSSGSTGDDGLLPTPSSTVSMRQGNRTRSHDEYKHGQQQEDEESHRFHGRNHSRYHKRPRRSQYDNGRRDTSPTVSSVSQICDLNVQPHFIRVLHQQQHENPRLSSSSSSILVPATEDSTSSVDESISITQFHIQLLHEQEQMQDDHSVIDLAQREVIRQELMQKCREKHKSLCWEVVGIAPPKESFNRWLFERRTLHSAQMAAAGEPLLPPLFTSGRNDGENDSSLIGPSLKREIMEDLPIKVNMFPRDIRDANNSIKMYVAAARKFLRQQEQQQQASSDNNRIEKVEMRILSMDQKSFLETHLAELSSATEKDATAESLIQLLKATKQECSDIIAFAMEPVVDSACEQLARFTSEQHEVLQRSDVRGGKKNVRERFSVTPSIKSRETRDGIVLELVGTSHTRDTKISIRRVHFDKLCALYRLWKERRAQLSLDQRKEKSSTMTASRRDLTLQEQQDMNSRIYTLLQRYETMFGKGMFEGGGFQAAVSERVFQELHSLFGVSMECFASPMNCYFPQYCSAFADTDVYFGSCGSFFDFHPTSGSFQANPPFSEEVMLSMINHIERLLATTEESLSFVVFVPNWTDADSIIRMNSSRWLRESFVLGAFAHTYVNGLQHRTTSFKRDYVAVHETVVFFLQNEAGYRRWTPTSDKVNQLKQLMAGLANEQTKK